MKRTELEALRAKSVEDLTTEVLAGRGQLLNGRMATVLEGKRQTTAKRNLRRHIARCLTIIRQKTV